ncbi:MAG: hypothetical protein H0X17_02170 [Deltaproteobacteria bacterium]|nr:hypothetical protein [Deltaproteobacteria bacterium]
MHERVALGLIALLAGCMTDQNGNRCTYSPGNDGQCPPDDRGGGGGGPTYRSYSSPAAVTEGDHLRVVMTTREGDQPSALETATVQDGAPSELAAVLLGGAPSKHVGAPQLSAIDDRILLGWNGGDQHRAAVLADGTLASTPIDLGDAKQMTLRRIGARWLAVHAATDVPLIDGTVTATWVTRDGALAGTVTLATGVQTLSSITDDPSGASPVFAIAFTRAVDDTGVRELRVARFSSMGERLGADSVVVARSVPKTFSVLHASVGAARDGSVLVVYAALDANIQREVHAVSIAMDGTLTEHPTALPPSFTAPQLIPHGDDFFALSILVGETETIAQTAIVSRAGSVLAGPTLAAAVAYGWPRAIATRDGFALVHDDVDVSVTHLNARGEPAETTIVATTHEVDSGGCHAAGSSSAGVALALIGLLRRRRTRGGRAIG